jgi:hypothetical protein
MTISWRRRCFICFYCVVIALTVTSCQRGHNDNSRAVSGGETEHPSASTPKQAAAQADERFKVVKCFQPPDDFVGNLAYDRESGRLWLVSLGPPANTKGPSILYEVDPNSGNILAQAEMPFLGEFGTPVYIDGFLYQGVNHESKLYKIAVKDKANFGKIVKTVSLPRYDEISVDDSAVIRLPFISYKGATVTPEKSVMIHAEDTGELITIDPETGKMLKRVKTVHAVGGITGFLGPEGHFLLVGNSDPANSALKAEMHKFMFRGAHGVSPLKSVRAELACRRHEEKLICWVLLDARTGELLASLNQEESRIHAESVALVKHETVPGTRYGRFDLLAVGTEGIHQVRWTPH